MIEVKIHLVGGRHLRLDTTTRGAKQVMDAVAESLTNKRVLDLSTGAEQRFVIPYHQILHAAQGVKEENNGMEE